ncbi:Gamma-aminobutyric acid type B receptor subunit 2, partial [Quaeritorhiza haematococci]
MLVDTGAQFANQTIFTGERNSSAQIGVAYLPGQSTFLGGSGFVITKGSKHPDIAWSLLETIVDPQSPYLSQSALATGSPPPYDSILQFDSTWSRPEWSVLRTQLARAIPLSYPFQAFQQFPDLEARRPFRQLLMELVFKNMTNAQVTSRACSLIEDVFAPQCTSEDMIPIVSDCFANQTRVLRWEWKANKTCKGDELPPLDNTIECSYVPRSSPTAIFVQTLTALAMLVSVAFMGGMYMYRHKSIIRRSSVFFNEFILVGSLLIYASVFLNMGVPTGFLCLGRVWFLGMGFAVCFGALFCKLWRVHRIFSDIHLSSASVRDAYLLRILGAIVFGEIIVLLVVSLIPPAPTAVITSVTRAFKSSSLSSSSSSPGSPLFFSTTYTQPECTPFNVVTLAFMGLYNLILLIFATYISWTIRQTPGPYNEGKFIGMAVYAITFTTSVTIPSLFLVQQVQSGSVVQVQFILSSLAVILSTVFSVVVLSAPKVIGAIRGIESEPGSSWDTGGSGSTGKKNGSPGFGG